jgi:hypothetical protein
VSRRAVIREPFVIATRIAARVVAVATDVGVAYPRVVSSAVSVVRAPTVAPAMTALTVCVAMPVQVRRLANSCGILVSAIPIVAPICIVVKIRAVEPSVVSMDKPVATVSIAVPAIRVAAACAVVVRFPTIANLSIIRALPTLTAAAISFARVVAVHVVVEMDAALSLERFVGPVRIAVDPTLFVIV